MTLFLAAERCGFTMRDGSMHAKYTTDNQGYVIISLAPKSQYSNPLFTSQLPKSSSYILIKKVFLSFANSKQNVPDIWKNKAWLKPSIPWLWQQTRCGKWILASSWQPMGFEDPKFNGPFHSIPNRIYPVVASEHIDPVFVTPNSLHSV